MTVLGLDLGAKRIGLAISDPDDAIAFPLGALQHATRERDLAALCELIAERGVERVVVGLPQHMDGRRGPEAERASAFAEALAQASGRPVETLDERWTSIEARRVLAASESPGTRRTRRKRREKGDVDAVAASIILRTYLELRRNERARAAAATSTPTRRDT